MNKNLRVRFDGDVDSKPLTDPSCFSAERWNYKRRANDGSPYFKLDGSRRQETLIPSSVYVSRDGRSVFVGIPELRPAMQMRLGWSLSATSGMAFADNDCFTPRVLIPFDPVKEGFAPLTVDLTSRRPQETKAKVDEACLRESIREPSLRVVAGFDKSDTGMPSYEGVITDSQIEALVLYIKFLR